MAAYRDNTRWICEFGAARPVPLHVRGLDTGLAA